VTARSVLRCGFVVVAIGVLAGVLAAARSSPGLQAADNPARQPHQVIACYFHRTIRCPTCQRIGAYIEEAIQTGFPAEVKAGSVKVVMIDFQDPRNQRYTQAYQITGPTLVIMDVRDGKLAAWKPAPRVWSLVGNKDIFMQYVRAEVQSYLESPRTAAR